MGMVTVTWDPGFKGQPGVHSESVVHMDRMRLVGVFDCSRNLTLSIVPV